MYYPVPGHTHLQVLLPANARPTPTPRPRPKGTRPRGEAPRGITPAPHTAAHAVRIALDAAFGVRSMEVLYSQRFSTTVRTHIASRIRRGDVGGPVQLTAFHMRESGEVFGTAVAAGRTYGFAARLEGGRLVSFKVL